MAKGKSNAESRPRKKSDSTYNARRRYARSAKRYIEQAEKATGAAASRYRRLAQESYKKALQTYSDTKQKVSKRIRDVGERLGIDYQKRRELYQDSKRDVRKLESESVEFTRAGQKVARQREAETIFNSSVGKRIIGGLEGIWRDAATGPDGKVDKTKIFPALFDYFQVDNLADLLDKIESVIGDELYTSQGDETENYDTVKMLLTRAYKSGAFVE